MGVMWLAFALGLAEATFFFIVPDVLLTLLALFAPREAMIACVVTLAGAMTGGLVVYVASLRDHDRTHMLVSRVPFVRDWMWGEVAEHYRRVGWHAPRLGPRSGIPYKLYAAEAPLHMSVWRFMLISIPARLTRFVLAAGACACIGLLLAGPIARHPSTVLIAHATGWTVFYAVYWWRVTAAAKRTPR
jgi:membrane protein YqaA with SNARE-associated domain